MKTFDFPPYTEIYHFKSNINRKEQENAFEKILICEKKLTFVLKKFIGDDNYANI